MPDLTQIVLKAQQMQAEMEQAQQSLADAEVTGTAGGGLVSAVLTGDGELQAVHIDRSVIDPDDAETLGDLIVAAVRDAQRAAGELSQATMGSITGGLAESLTGFGFDPTGTMDTLDVTDPLDAFGTFATVDPAGTLDTLDVTDPLDAFGAFGPTDTIDTIGSVESGDTEGIPDGPATGRSDRGQVEGD